MPQQPGLESRLEEVDMANVFSIQNFFERLNETFLIHRKDVKLKNCLQLISEQRACDPSEGRQLIGVWKRGGGGGGGKEGNGVNSPQQLKPIRDDLSRSPCRVFTLF